jgi:voltage-gated potassium channel
MAGGTGAWSRLQNTRATVGFYLNDIQTPIGVVLDLCITLLVLVSTAIFVAQTYPMPTRVREVLDFVNAGILWIFVAEFVVRLWSAEHRWRFLFSVYSVIDLLTIVPFLVGVGDVGYIRIFRWFRILRLVRFLESKVLWGNLNESDRTILLRILFTLFAIVFVYSGLIYQVEHVVNPEGFKTFLDAFYFSIVTMTTVGFGDVTPISEGGRLLTVLMIVTGVGLIPWQVGDLVRRLVKSTAQLELLCRGCGLQFHDVDAGYCKRCGTALRR